MFSNILQFRSGKTVIFVCLLSAVAVPFRFTPCIVPFRFIYLRLHLEAEIVNTRSWRSGGMPT